MVKTPKTRPISRFASIKSDVECRDLDLRVAYIPTAKIAAKNTTMQSNASRSISPPFISGVDRDIEDISMGFKSCVCRYVDCWGVYVYLRLNVYVSMWTSVIDRRTRDVVLSCCYLKILALLILTQKKQIS